MRDDGGTARFASRRPQINNHPVCGFGDRAIVDRGWPHLAHRAATTTSAEWDGCPEHRVQLLPVARSNELSNS